MQCVQHGYQQQLGIELILHHVLLNRRTGDVRAGCDVVHSGSKKLVDSSSGSS